MLRATHTINLGLKKGRKNRYRVAGQRAQIQKRGLLWDLNASRLDGHESITRLRTLTCSQRRSLLLLHPRTGRSHQLRVHLSWIGYPIMGDHLYGSPEDPAQHAPRLQLHCHRLSVPGFGTFATQPGRGWLRHAAS